MLIMVVPNSLEIIVKEFLLVSTTNLSHFGYYVASCYVRLVFSKDATPVCITISCHILIDTLFNILLIMSDVFFLLDQALPFFLFLFLFPLIFKLLHFLLLQFFFLLALYLVNAVLLFLLGIFWTVDPLDTRLSLVILVHERHYFIEFGLVLSFLLSIPILSLYIIFCLHISNFD